MFGIKINWDVLWKRICTPREDRTMLERVAQIALFIIGWVVGFKIGMWLLS